MIPFSSPATLGQIGHLDNGTLRLAMGAVPELYVGVQIEVVLAFQDRHIYLPFMAKLERIEGGWMRLIATPPADVQITLRALCPSL